MSVNPITRFVVVMSWVMVAVLAIVGVAVMWPLIRYGVCRP